MLKEWCRMSVIQLSYYGALTRQAVFFIFKKYTRVDVKKHPVYFVIPHFSGVRMALEYTNKN